MYIGTHIPTVQSSSGSSVVDPRLFFLGAGSCTFQEIPDPIPDPTPILSTEAKAKVFNKSAAEILILKKGVLKPIP